MSCADFEAFILDEALPKPAGHDAHVAACASCRALKAGHRAALALEGVTLRRATKVPLARAQRRLSVMAAVCLVVGGTAGLVALEGRGGETPVEALGRDAVAVTPSVDVEVPALASVRGEEDDGWAGLAELQGAVASQSQWTSRDDEVLSRSFGALPAWVAPTKTYPLRRLGAAASHLVYTSED